MHIIDLLIVIVPFCLIVYLALRSRIFARDAVDFLAAGRVANRYVLCAGDMAATMSVLSIVATVETNYVNGFALAFWGKLFVPISIIMALFGFVTYRWREVQCLSRGQFIEMRYDSKVFRVATSAVATVAELTCNALYPAVTANFFIYYLGIPHHFTLLGVTFPTFAVVVVLCIMIALLMIIPSGRVSLLITDAIQGVLSYPIFAIISVFILFKLDFDQDVAATLADRVPGQSFLNPYDIQKFRDFNIFATIVNIVNNILNRGAWYGNDTTNSAKTPHEQKMAGILSSFRNGFAITMVPLLGILAYCFMHGANFNSINERNSFQCTSDQVRLQLSEHILGEIIPEDEQLRSQIIERLQAIPPEKHEIGLDEPYSQEGNPDTRFLEVVGNSLGDTPEGRHRFQRFKAVFSQMRGPVLFSKVFPAGIYGLFVLLMLMLLISTDDSHIFNAAGGIVQDIVLPLSKEELTPQRQIRWLRISSMLVGLFFMVIAIFFSKIDYIWMITTILSSIWLGGAGPIILGGLYTRFGNLTGAWCALVFGSGFSTSCCIIQQTWVKHICPWIEGHPGWYDSLDGMLRSLSAPFEPWIHWEMSTIKFPINSYEILAISMILSCGAYVVGSLVSGKRFNLDKLLHRGAYASPEKLAFVAEQKAILARQGIFRRILNTMISITPEYTKADRIIAWAMFFYSFVWSFIVIWCGVLLWNAFSPFTIHGWKLYLLVSTFIVGIVVGIISTIWFGIGATWGIIQLFKDLRARKIDITETGKVKHE